MAVVISVLIGCVILGLILLRDNGKFLEDYRIGNCFEHSAFHCGKCNNRNCKYYQMYKFIERAEDERMKI